MNFEEFLDGLDKVLAKFVLLIYKIINMLTNLSNSNPLNSKFSVSKIIIDSLRKTFILKKKK